MTSLLDQSPPDTPSSTIEPSTDSSEHDAANVPAPRFGRRRPCGLAPGGGALIAAWLVGVAIARLTGAAAVVLLLVVGAVTLGASAISGWIRLRSLTGIEVSAPRLVTVGESFELRIDHVDSAVSRTPVTAIISPIGTDDSTVVPLTEDSVRAEFAVTRAGSVDHLDASLETNGTAGLVWWKRTVRLPVPGLSVAPAAVGPTLHVDEHASDDDGSSTGGRGRPIGDIDGIRPWRHGESDQSIHWPSTIRSRSIVARARQSAVETTWTVPLESDPGRLRWTLESGLRHGHEVRVALPDGSTNEVLTTDDAARRSSTAADLQRSEEPATQRTPIWKRSISLSGRVHEPATVGPVSRWSAAVAAALAINMLIGALDGSTATRAVATAGIGAGAVLAVWLRHRAAPFWLRASTVAIAIAALAQIAVKTSGIGGLIEALRGPMPDLLMLLLVLHGVESLSRRTVRVHLAFSAVVVTYAAGLRIDDRVGWWMLGWGTATLTTLATLSQPTEKVTGPVRTARRTSRRRWGRSMSWGLLALVSAFGLASLVPIPDGPASLGLPAISSDDAAVEQPGSLAGPAGDTPPPSTSNSAEAPNRGALGEVAGYPGFSETLDTSVRGDLGDEIVMRVRAPEPAFWRGQTFTEFDGRTWRVTGGDGPNVDGPQIDVEPTLGDLPATGVPTEEFVQTFHVEANLPNVIFAASRPEIVVFDGSVNTRPDGSLRADRTLDSGTIYTVVSERVQVTPELLRAQGDLRDRFDAIVDPRADALLAPYLALPDSTTERTLALAERLRVDASTYDTVIAYQNWLSANTEYDLDAPVPASGADAVDDYLFESRRGFCEQIASSLVVMLRSQGVPARLATGYIPGERDQVSGVWKVRASDAHAWVEVWFPDTGWEAFDPTAVVPLAGETNASTVGNDVADAVVSGIAARPVEVALVALFVALVLASIRGVAESRRRRARGPWGLLHDRFSALAPEARTVHDIADVLEARSPGTDPRVVSNLLDRVAFDPTFEPSSDDRRATSRAIRELERRR